jgi:hypothetical protein
LETFVDRGQPPSQPAYFDQEGQEG